MLEHAKPDQIVELVLPFLWAALSDGRAPANICVDACLTLRNAYGRLGVRAELLPVTVAIRKKNGTGTLYGSLTPTWTGTSWNGHCALVLPGSERFVDPTIEQFDEVRTIGMGPMVGKVAMSTREDGSLMEPGAQVMLQRGDLVLTYTVAGPEALASIVEHPDEAQDVRFRLLDQSGQEQWLRGCDWTRSRCRRTLRPPGRAEDRSSAKPQELMP